VVLEEVDIFGHLSYFLLYFAELGLDVLEVRLELHLQRPLLLLRLDSGLSLLHRKYYLIALTQPISHTIIYINLQTII